VCSAPRSGSSGASPTVSTSRPSSAAAVSLRAAPDFAERGYDETRAAVAAASEEEGEGRGADR
jgi:hypothetical protein